MKLKSVLFLFFIFRCALAQTPDSLFNLGNSLYASGKYQNAIDTYEHILNLGYISPDIYFNLGNANYRLERLAKAILAYERAARLRAHDPDIEHNLKLLYLKTIDRIEPVPELFLLQWLRAIGLLVSPEAVRLLFILSWIVLFCSLSIMYFISRLLIIRITRAIFLLSIGFVLVWLIMLGIQSMQDTSSNDSIITVQTVTAKSSPDAKSIDAFVAHEGLKVKMTDAVGNWVKITLPDGKVGWIESSQCESI